MKFGCLYYADSENIGDDIQTYAQRRFLPQVDYWVDRESLNTFVPDAEERVAMIMNAWFMYSPQNWPPTPYILPLFVSTHFSQYHVQWLKTAEKKYEFARQYLVQNAPIGCRDASTMEHLRKLGIEAYFSGCLTLTLPEFPDVQPEDVICLVDVPAQVEEYVRSKGYQVRVMTHQQDTLRSKSIRERMEQAESCLKQYQSARCVITTRLHCALPSTGLQTPVLVLYSDSYEERFRALKDFFHTTDIQTFLDGAWDAFLECPQSKGTQYLPYREKLIRTCSDFVRRAAAMPSEFSVPNRNGQQREAARFRQMIERETYLAQIRQLSEAYQEHETYIRRLESSRTELQTMNGEYASQIQQLRDENERVTERLGSQLRQLSSELDYEKHRCAELQEYNGRLRNLRASLLSVLREETDDTTGGFFG